MTNDVGDECAEPGNAQAVAPRSASANDHGGDAYIWRASRSSTWARADFGNLAVWTPVAIGCGVGAYFGLKTEPAWQIGFIALAISLFILISGAALCQDCARRRICVSGFCRRRYPNGAGCRANP